MGQEKCADAGASELATTATILRTLHTHGRHQKLKYPWSNFTSKDLTLDSQHSLGATSKSVSQDISLRYFRLLDFNDRKRLRDIS
jgi:hypothetical protein